MEDIDVTELDRDPDIDIDVFGPGTRRLQIIKLPTDGAGKAWEFSFLDGPGWAVGVIDARWGDGPHPVLSGYQKVRVLGDALMGIHQKITSVSFPMFIPPMELPSKTGTYYELAVWGGMRQSIRLHWWNTQTEGGWQDFTNYIQEVILMLERMPVDDRAPVEEAAGEE